ncbi:MAG TPA: hypothetical protein VGF13_19000 [Verrucomicrobiae bacterium]
MTATKIPNAKNKTAATLLVAKGVALTRCGNLNRRVEATGHAQVSARVLGAR